MAAFELSTKAARPIPKVSVASNSTRMASACFCLLRFAVIAASARVESLMLLAASGWGSVCSEGWTKESERVACMALGFSGMKVRREERLLMGRALLLFLDLHAFRRAASVLRAART